MRFLLLAALVFALAVPAARTGAEQPPQYLVTWAMESNLQTRAADGTGRDFLAVYDIGNAHFGRLVAMLPVPTRAHMAHHANYSMPWDRMLFANDFMEDRTYVFDVRDPLKPRVAASFGAAGPFTHAHSFVRLTNGHTLATFQDRDGKDAAAGALVELDNQGRVLRTSDAAAPQTENFIRPYSLEVLENLDRVVTTSADMMPTTNHSHVVQIWRLSDLKLLQTIVLPKPAIFKGIAAQDADEARVLADGETVMIKTASCGLFRLTGLQSAHASVDYVYDLGGRQCSSVPLVMGNYWLEESISMHSITVLDVSDSANPREVSRLYLGPNAGPHWQSRDPASNRIAITGFGSLLNTIKFATLDPRTGALTLDSRSIVLDNVSWPDGWSGRAIPHATLFY